MTEALVDRRGGRVVRSGRFERNGEGLELLLPGRRRQDEVGRDEITGHAGRGSIEPAERHGAGKRAATHVTSCGLDGNLLATGQSLHLRVELGEVSCHVDRR